MPAVDLVPSLVTLHVWGVGTRQVPAAMAAMAVDRRAFHRSAGLTFVKMLGTGDGRTFTVRDADPRHWAVLACWADERALDAFERSAVVARWDERSAQSPVGERLTVTMRPLTSRGRWDEREPFGRPEPAEPYDGAVAAVTRARLRATQAVRFWRAVPPVSARLSGAAGLRLRLGIGEAPVGLQGTFSLWRSAADLEAFAYGTHEHRTVVRRTRETGWYREELFARLAVLSVRGTLGGHEVVA